MYKFGLIVIINLTFFSYFELVSWNSRQSIINKMVYDFQLDKLDCLCFCM